MLVNKQASCAPEPPQKKKLTFNQNPGPKTIKISQIANNPLNPYRSSKPQTRRRHKKNTTHARNNHMHSGENVSLQIQERECID